MTRPRLLDLFCGAGGCSVGYHRAGFDVEGVDNRYMPRYPFTFHQADAMKILEDRAFLADFDVIHASPPCQDHSATRTNWNARDHGTGWMLTATRDRLQRLGRPYVIENVPGADMPGELTLCGAAFGLGAVCRDGTWRPLRRHRLFESDQWLMGGGCACGPIQPIGIYGVGGGGQMTRGYKATKVEAIEALGIDWMNKAELAQAIPPAYTEYIGAQLLDHLRAGAA